MFKKIIKFIDKKTSGHISIGRLTVYGRNAMHWGVTYWTKKWGYICFRLPFTCWGRWFPLYFYVSSNATPWASTFMLGIKHDPADWALSRVRKVRLGHRINTNDEDVYKELRKINNMI